MNSFKERIITGIKTIYFYQYNLFFADYFHLRTKTAALILSITAAFFI